MKFTFQILISNYHFPFVFVLLKLARIPLELETKKVQKTNFAALLGCCCIADAAASSDAAFYVFASCILPISNKLNTTI